MQICFYKHEYFVIKSKNWSIKYQVHTCVCSWGYRRLAMSPCSKASDTSVVQKTWQPAITTWPGHDSTHSTRGCWRVKRACRDLIKSDSLNMPHLEIVQTSDAIADNTSKTSKWESELHTSGYSLSEQSMLSLSVAFIDFSTSLSQSSTFPVGHTGRNSFTSSPSPEYIWVICRSDWNWSWKPTEVSVLYIYACFTFKNTCFFNFKETTRLDKPLLCSQSICASEVAQQ